MISERSGQFQSNEFEMYLNMSTRAAKSIKPGNLVARKLSALPGNFSIKGFSDKFLRKTENLFVSSFLLIIIPGKMEILANINLSTDSYELLKNSSL